MPEKDAVGDRLHQAKRPVSSLAGPYGHPFHPLLVTVPIGAWVASLGFDIASHAADQPGVYARGAYWLIAIGVAGALVAATAGFLDLFAIPTGTPAFRTGLVHMSLNLAVVVLFAVSFLIRRGDFDPAAAVGGGPIALSAVALVLLAVSGWLGAKLSFRYGVRVADETTQASGFTDQKGDN